MISIFDIKSVIVNKPSGCLPLYSVRSMKLQNTSSSNYINKTDNDTYQVLIRKQTILFVRTLRDKIQESEVIYWATAPFDINSNEIKRDFDYIWWRYISKHNSPTKNIVMQYSKQGVILFFNTTIWDQITTQASMHDIVFPITLSLWWWKAALQNFSLWIFYFKK